MTEVIASDPMLRADLRICRSLGVTLTRFLNLPSDSEYDDFERTLWRAFAAYEASLCPHCGQPRDEALYDADRPTQPVYEAGYTQCLGCKELLTQQEKQRVRDARALRLITENHKHPDEVERPVIGHRQWFVRIYDALRGK